MRTKPQCISPEPARPLLMVDIDGVISLFGPSAWTGRPPGARDRCTRSRAYPTSFRPGRPHTCWSSRRLFELVWASGWEEKAGEHLPRLLGLPREIPHLSFERGVGRSNAHWKLDAIDAYAGGRALAWVDDALNEACHEWARLRPCPTLLIQTDPEVGLTAERDRPARELGARTLS